jgi:hypothetical protein
MPSLVVTGVLATGTAHAGSGRLDVGEYLFPGQRLTQSCYYSLRMNTTGELVAYSGNTPNWWAPNTMGVGGYATMRADGNFAVNNWSDAEVWSTHTVNQTYYAGGYCTGPVHCPPSGTAQCICDGTYVPISSYQTNNFVRQRDDGYVGVYSLGNSSSALWSPGYWSDWLGTTCTAPEQKTIVKVNFDRPGNNYRMVPIAERRPSWCGYHCAGDPQCKAYAYTYPGPNGEPAMCWLKNTVTTPVPLNGAVTGQVVGR